MSNSFPSVAQLPESAFCKVGHFSAISIKGEERFSYLQGQVTCDVNSLEEKKLLIGSHCDAKGKVLSVFRLIEQGDTLFLIQPKSTLSASLTELKKFGVFAKVEIDEADISLTAFIGNQSNALLSSKINQLPDENSPVVHLDNASLLYFNGALQRYLLINNKGDANAFSAQVDLSEVDESVWTLTELLSGVPVLREASVQTYVPQMINLDNLNGISFDKGCYLGQETVARMQYLGKNKKAMTLATAVVNETPASFIVEKQVGENWRTAGDLINSYVSDDGTCYVQLVTSNDLDQNTKLRFKEQPETQLSLQATPYISL